MLICLKSTQPVLLMKRPHPLFFLFMSVALTVCGFFNIVINRNPNVSVLSLTVILTVMAIPLIGNALLANKVFEFAMLKRVPLIALIYNSVWILIIQALHYISLTELIRPETLPEPAYTTLQELYFRSILSCQFTVMLSGFIHFRYYEIDATS